jgi:hypothetical protein
MKPHLFAYIVAATCLFLLNVQTVCAGTGGTATLISPAKADAIASPLTFLTIQTKTETDAGLLASSPTMQAGIDSYFRSNYKLLDLPLAVALSPDLKIQLNVPFVFAPNPTPADSSQGQLGDLGVSVKYRTNVDTDYDAYFILTARLPTGEPGSSYGGGSYDFTFTHKSVFKCGDYRNTLMAGVTLPPPFDFTVQGNGVVYAPNVAYMAATERSLPGTGFAFAFKLAGLHAFSSRINSELQKNSVTTLDAIPEVSYRFSDKGSSLGLGVIIPAFTWYELPGAKNSRDPILNLSINGYF